MHAEPSPNNSSPSCSPQYPCNRFYHCDRCARRRQARWADVAERIEAAFGPLQLAVITPNENTARALDAAKRSALRAAISPAMMWSIETGQQFGRLHLNLIGPNLANIAPRGAAVNVSTIRTNARAAAAYITKKSGYPSKEHYAGRIVGTAGHVMQHLAQARHMPVAQAGAILKMLETANYYPTHDPDAQPTTADSLRQMTAAFADDLASAEREMIHNMRK